MAVRIVVCVSVVKCVRISPWRVASIVILQMQLFLADQHCMHSITNPNSHVFIVIPIHSEVVIGVPAHLLEVNGDIGFCKTAILVFGLLVK